VYITIDMLGTKVMFQDVALIEKNIEWRLRGTKHVSFLTPNPSTWYSFPGEIIFVQDQN